MDNGIKRLFLRIGWTLPYIRFLSSSKTVILMYHGAPREAHAACIDGRVFERHVNLLKQHFDIIPPGRLFERTKSLDKIRILLTFDDGFRNQAVVTAPILRKHCVPAFAAYRRAGWVECE